MDDLLRRAIRGRFCERGDHGHAHLVDAALDELGVGARLAPTEPGDHIGEVLVGGVRVGVADLFDARLLEAESQSNFATSLQVVRRHIREELTKRGLIRRPVSWHRPGEDGGDLEAAVLRLCAVASRPPEASARSVDEVASLLLQLRGERAAQPQSKPEQSLSLVIEALARMECSVSITPTAGADTVYVVANGEDLRIILTVPSCEAGRVLRQLVEAVVAAAESLLAQADSAALLAGILYSARRTNENTQRYEVSLTTAAKARMRRDRYQKIAADLTPQPTT